MLYNTLGVLYDTPGIIYDQMAAPAPRSLIAQIADAAAGEIAAASWPLTFTLNRSWLPLRSLADESNLNQVTTTPRLSIVPRELSLDEHWTRSLQRQLPTLTLVLQARLADQTPASVDPLTQLLEQLKDWFEDNHQLAGVTFVCRCATAKILTWCWAPHLELDVYTGAIVPTFTVAV